ncbi:MULTISPECIES: MoxR family ATPase [unclassified Paenibacillus]|uniref:AAA family ATPase n=1 Tax=unclassified Paenibacillus TaxID=185978 RepID=UPI002477171A|nr:MULTISPECIES: MoxR family ATPase [unclassified Paenibacillus]MDH6427163.1 MoxR-like ATPase [Paenibacillus sp. PastH-4]MDH6443192.1 MoxR-like ATPase [Paenibacillus sp. PastF-4]MDH6526103.1 MoxR-like ATPase [Paenibacillus sp. PastH-3]
MNLQEVAELIRSIRANLAKVIVGKEEGVDLLLTALLANGHVLLEDVPGTGKTLLAKVLAKSLDCSFKRIQFTPDLLPSDLSGINYYNQKTGEFQFRPGPVFANILLADEINRATPRTQSSLLECMEERQITIDGVTHGLEAPFLVIATQNPIDNQGTFPLPEAQLDRFLMRITTGYPTFDEGIHILQRFRENNPLEESFPVATSQDIQAAQRLAASVSISDDLLGYIVRITEATRKSTAVKLGASPRASGALLRSAQGYALIQGRSYVTPDDIKAVAVSVLAHRLLLHRGLGSREGQAADIVLQVLREVEVPAEPVTSLRGGKVE